jgi:hypothetical protein
MAEIMYKPEDVGKTIVGPRGKPTTLRRYHLTDKQMIQRRAIWEETVKDVPKKIKDMAGPLFFNPYRNGIYFAQIQAMFLLGANKWHNLLKIRDKMKQTMSSIIIKKRDKLSGITTEITAWEQFKYKNPRSLPELSKDNQGRIRENRLHPSGYKLRQVCAAVDIKRVTRPDFPNGLFFYRLSTYKTVEEALPMRDFTEFIFTGKKGKYVSNKFIGRTITKDAVMVNGKVI